MRSLNLCVTADKRNPICACFNIKRDILELMGIHLNNICERRLLQSIKQNIKTEFYLDLLTTWFHFLTPTIFTLDELLIENIFNNPMFLITGEVITQKDISGKILVL